ncbi:MAG: hypothetical protein GF401_10905 [Chitinivibrionales bacterium]|nr:hypothetical protein [Chitinivibrionales bacterium]
MMPSSDTHTGGKAHYRFVLFVASDEPNSLRALNNLNNLCSGKATKQCTIHVIDVYKDFEAALKERIVVTPTLLVTCDDPAMRMTFFGSLDDKDAIAQQLNIEQGDDG